MSAFLFFEALLQCFHELLPAAKRLDLLAFFFSQIELGHLAQPLFRKFNFLFAFDRLEAFEHMTENAIELIDMSLVFDHGRARQVVKVID